MKYFCCGLLPCLFLLDIEFKSPIGDRSSKLLSGPVHDLHTLDLFNYFFLLPISD